MNRYRRPFGSVFAVALADGDPDATTRTLAVYPSAELAHRAVAAWPDTTEGSLRVVELYVCNDLPRSITHHQVSTDGYENMVTRWVLPGRPAPITPLVHLSDTGALVVEHRSRAAARSLIQRLFAQYRTAARDRSSRLTAELFRDAFGTPGDPEASDKTADDGALEAAPDEGTETPTED